MTNLKKTWVSLLVLALLPQFGKGQDFLVQARLMEEKTQQPIPSATIRLEKNPQWQTQTNTEGYFSLKLPDSLQALEQIHVQIQIHVSEDQFEYGGYFARSALADSQPFLMNISLPAYVAMADLSKPSGVLPKDSTANLALSLEGGEMSTKPEARDTLSAKSSKFSVSSPLDQQRVLSIIRGSRQLLDSLEYLNQEQITSSEKSHQMQIFLQNSRQLLDSLEVLSAGENIIENIQQLEQNIIQIKEELLGTWLLTPERKVVLGDKLEELEKNFSDLSQQLKNKNLIYQRMLQNLAKEIKTTKDLLNHALVFNQRLIVYILSFLLFLFLISGLFIYLFLRIRGQKQQLLHLSTQLQQLLQEVHHRVKNNLQNINSILDLQSDVKGQASTEHIIRDIKSRIYSMALIHDVLYQSEDLASIDMKDYIQNLVDHLLQTLASPHQRIHCQFQIENIRMDMDKATNIGLIVNELVSNSFKYAFKGRQEGLISIAIFKLGNHHQLLVKDDGVGLPENFDPYQAQSLGLKLVRCFAINLEGELKISSKSGTNIQVDFEN